MGSEGPETEGHHFVAEADAVCEQCGTVNPEGTLLCKACGNNLREQFERRVAEGRAGGTFEAPSRSKAALKGLLTAFGILLIIWVALNVEDIPRWLIGAGDATTDPVKAMWQGSQSGIFDQLSSKLGQMNFSDADIELAESTANLSEDYTGYYILKQDLGFGANVVGKAYVVEQSQLLYFVAELQQGVEVRGTANVEHGNRPTARHSASIKLSNGDYLAAFGFASKQEDGTMKCYGQSQADDKTRSVVAYRIPQE